MSTATLSRTKLETLTKCPVCLNKNLTPFIQTKTMMHPPTEDFNFDVCKDCSSVFLNPRVKAEFLGPYYQDYYLPYRTETAWGKYAKVVANSQNKLDKERVKICIKAMPLNKNSMVLDLGCGKPSFLKMLEAKSNCQTYGVDFSSNGWEAEKEQYQNLELIEGDLETVKALNQKFDLITMWHYLEHDYEPTATIQTLKKLLKPNGKLIIEVPNLNSLTRKWQGAFWEGWHTPRHTVLYSPETLRFLLEENSFKVEKALEYGTMDAFALFWMGQMEKKGIDWSDSMEQRFWTFVMLKIATWPVFAMKRFLPLGIQLVVAEVKDKQIP